MGSGSAQMGTCAFFGWDGASAKRSVWGKDPVNGGMIQWLDQFFFFDNMSKKLCQ
jgi:hypothetical protein